MSVRDNSAVVRLIYIRVGRDCSFTVDLKVICYNFLTIYTKIVYSFYPYVYFLAQNEYRNTGGLEKRLLKRLTLIIDMLFPAYRATSQNRKSWSFSNERMREIERHNRILLRKILSQKPTYTMNSQQKLQHKMVISCYLKTNNY